MESASNTHRQGQISPHECPFAEKNRDVHTKPGRASSSRAKEICDSIFHNIPLAPFLEVRKGQQRHTQSRGHEHGCVWVGVEQEAGLPLLIITFEMSQFCFRKEERIVYVRLVSGGSETQASSPHVQPWEQGKQHTNSAGTGFLVVATWLVC